MNGRWIEQSLGDVCDIINGSTPLRANKSFWENGDIPWFTIDDIRSQGRMISKTQQHVTMEALEKTSLRLLPSKSVLLCCTASVGEYAISEIPLTTNQQFNGLVIKNLKILDPSFLFWFCATLKEKLLDMSGKTTIDFVPISRLKSILIPLPPLPEQQRIVALLDQAFEGIEKVIGNTRRNLYNAQELFNSYHNEVFISPGYDWTEKELREVWHIEKKQNKGELLPYVGLEDIEAHTSKFLGSIEPKAVKSNSFLFNDNHLLYGRLRPYLNKVLLPCFEGHCSTEIFPIITKPCLEKKFLYYWLTRRLIVERINDTCTGARMPRANMDLVSRYKISFPENQRQREIVRFLDELSQQVTKLKSVYEKKLEKLDELRKSILTQVFFEQ